MRALQYSQRWYKDITQCSWIHSPLYGVSLLLTLFNVVFLYKHNMKLKPQQNNQRTFLEKRVETYFEYMDTALYSNQNFIIFPSNFCHVSILCWLRPSPNPSWELHYGTSKDEVECLLQYMYKAALVRRESRWNNIFQIIISLNCMLNSPINVHDVKILLHMLCF